MGLSHKQMAGMADLSAATIADFKLGGLVHFCRLDAIQVGP